MNDRFRFRAWDKTQDTMVEFDLFDHDCDYIGQFVGVKEPVMAKNCVIMQCTGLKDKNGKLIFEGDIVSFDHEMTADNSLGVLPNGWNFDEETKLVVEWSDTMVGWRVEEELTQKEMDEWGEHAESYRIKYLNHAMSLIVDGKAKIIGNKFENPELFNK